MLYLIIETKKAGYIACFFHFNSIYLALQDLL